LHVSCYNLTESYGIISLWGCNQTPTYAPPADLSSYFNTQYESGNAIMTRAFTKSTSERGNDVYKGVARNATTPETNTWTIVIELTTSKAEAKQLYDQTVAQKINEGYTIQPDRIALEKAEEPFLTEVWVGLKSLPKAFTLSVAY
jgi:hypothetical protein